MDACPNCQHPHHLPGTECQTPVHHGPHRWHLCLCLARPGATLSCPPQMTCQGGTLGYADLWYLQHGHVLVGEDGEIAPAAVEPGVASVGFPSEAAVTPPVAAPATQAALAEDLRYVLNYRGPGHAHEKPGVWDTSGKPCEHCARLAAAREHLAAHDANHAVLAADSGRAAALLRAADIAEDVAESLRKHHEFERSTGALDVMAELRRVAAEATPVAASSARANETAPSVAAPLSDTDRQFLTFALDLAADQMASPRGVVFTDEDAAAMAKLRRVAAESAPADTGHGDRPDGWTTDQELHLLRLTASALEESRKELRAEAARLRSQLWTLGAALEGMGRLLATSSRDWGQYRVDAWLWAVLCGWDCEVTEHDDTCTHGAMEEMAAKHGWDDAAVAKARRYRAAVHVLTEPAAGLPAGGTQHGGEAK
jgi:hypothetical protein